MYSESVIQGLSVRAFLGSIGKRVTLYFFFIPSLTFFVLSFELGGTNFFSSPPIVKILIILKKTIEKTLTNHFTILLIYTF